MLNIEEIYKETKYLDDLFSLQFDIKSPEIIKKYKLELLVELLYLSQLLGFTLEDLTNETKRKSQIIQKRLKSNY